MQPRLVPPLLALQGLMVIALTLSFVVAWATWALGEPEARAFRYLPGPIALGMTWGAALWADFGPARVHPRGWRLAGFVVGSALEVLVAVVVLQAVLRR